MVMCIKFVVSHKHFVNKKIWTVEKCKYFTYHRYEYLASEGLRKLYCDTKNSKKKKRKHFLFIPKQAAYRRICLRQ